MQQRPVHCIGIIHSTQLLAGRTQLPHIARRTLLAGDRYLPEMPGGRVGEGGACGEEARPLEFACRPAAAAADGMASLLAHDEIMLTVGAAVEEIHQSPRRAATEIARPADRVGPVVVVASEIVQNLAMQLVLLQRRDLSRRIETTAQGDLSWRWPHATPARPGQTGAVKAQRQYGGSTALYQLGDCSINRQTAPVYAALTFWEDADYIVLPQAREDLTHGGGVTDKLQFRYDLDQAEKGAGNGLGTEMGADHKTHRTMGWQAESNEDRVGETNMVGQYHQRSAIIANLRIGHDATAKEKENDGACEPVKEAVEDSYGRGEGHRCFLSGLADKCAGCLCVHGDPCTAVDPSYINGICAISQPQVIFPVLKWFVPASKENRKEAFMLAVTNVTKRYRRVLANDQISLQVPSGVTAVLAGPNGAGKSTLLKCIMGLLRFEGSIHIAGHHNKSLEAKRLSGYVPEVPQMYPLLTVAEHLELVARLYGVADWETKAESLLERFELADKRSKLGSELSKGMQQKVSICSALLPEPRLLLLDEPLIGLDPHAIRELKLMLAELRAAGCSLLLSTHILDSIEDIWDVVLVMKNGRFIAEITPELLAERGVDLETMFFSLTENSSVTGAEAP